MTKLQDRCCSSCNKTFKEIYGLPLPSKYDIHTISDGWNNDKICHYCFPKASDKQMADDYFRVTGEILRYEDGREVGTE